MKAPREQRAPDDDLVAPAIAAAEYSVLAGVIGNIFSEYWQGNAFFMAFASVGFGTLVANWPRFAAAPILVVVGIVALYVFMLGIWLFTMSRHYFYLEVHMAHMRSIEERTQGLDVYSHRIAKARSSRMPSARKTWMAVPVVFAIAVLITGTSAVLDDGAEDDRGNERRDVAKPARMDARTGSGRVESGHRLHDGGRVDRP